MVYSRHLLGAAMEQARTCADTTANEEAQTNVDACTGSALWTGTVDAALARDNRCAWWNSYACRP